MSHNNKGVSKEEAIRRRFETGAVQLEDPAAAKHAQQGGQAQPAQVPARPKSGKAPASEDVPPPGDMGPPEGPGA